MSPKQTLKGFSDDLRGWARAYHEVHGKWPTRLTFRGKTYLYDRETGLGEVVKKDERSRTPR